MLRMEQLFKQAQVIWNLKFMASVKIIFLDGFEKAPLFCTEISNHKGLVVSKMFL